MARTVRINPLTATALALTVLAAGCAGWGGWSWYTAAHDDSSAYAIERDEVLAAGEQAVLNLNTLDHRTMRRDLDTWVDSTTGSLRDQLTQGRAQFERQIGRAGTVTSARVLSGAVTELDERAGKASVLVAVRITVTPMKAAGAANATQGKPVPKESRLLGELTRTDTGWKLSALGQAPVGDSPAE
ncbi:hypothetical protein ACFVIM_15115 [Streptomyces sp. NPDC057638]|uniref:hypothetical protein n=1 Tax=Streptomyces sp. NPDC057638 TaxID=3346190 RepID=UPI00368CDA82